LLLLQRPVAKEVRSELAGFIRQRQMPLSLHALYAYRYALEPDDIPFLQAVSEWADTPELSGRAGLYLLKLGSKDGLAGVQAALVSADEELRAQTYSELAEYLSQTVIAARVYDPSNPGDLQRAAVENLLDHVMTK
jgi:hypothetical protein